MHEHIIQMFGFKDEPRRFAEGQSAISRFEQFAEGLYPIFGNNIDWNTVQATEELFFENTDYKQASEIVKELIQDYALTGRWSLVCTTPELHIEADIIELVEFIPFIENLPEENFASLQYVPIFDDYWLFHWRSKALIEITHEGEIFFAKGPQQH